MKQKVSDYIAEYIAQCGIQDVFTVTGVCRNVRIICKVEKK